MDSMPKKSIEVGTVINGKWIVLELIGRGGMGEVYRVHQLNLKRDAAIKIISPKCLEEIEGNDYETETCLERFRREVQVMAQIHHPNVIQIYDYGSIPIKSGNADTTVEYISMQYIPGATLRSTMSPEGFYPEEDRVREWLTTYFLPLLDGVHALHELGIIHRDLKPENVLLDGTTPKIADFGLARSFCSKPVTQSMDMRGTPPYMSPEHFMDLKRTDQRTDVYALGKILYEAISGKMGSSEIPFKKASLKNPGAAFFKKMDRIIQDATAEDRNERIPSAKALKQAIEEILNGTGKPLKPGMLFKRSADGKIPRLRTQLVVGIFVIIAAIAIGIGAMVLQKGRNIPPAASLTGTSEEEIADEGANEPASLPNPPPPVLQGKNGDVLHLITGAEIARAANSPADTGQFVKIDPFYLEETQVTNHQYVKFLNKVLSRVKVENGVVKGDGQIWLFLGEVKKGYEPIVCRKEKFYLNSSSHAACPVLRVTGYGALAYARFFGRRLPTEKEWLYLARGDDKAIGRFHQPDIPGIPAVTDKTTGIGTQTESQVQPALPVPSPVILGKPDLHGIRGINGSMGEWGLRKLHASNENPMQERVYSNLIVLGRIMSTPDSGDTSAPSVQRYPWEAFEEVGFRTALSIR